MTEPDKSDITFFLEQLDINSSWRKNELLRAYYLAENTKNDEDQRYLCRSWVLIMYAHCDNFLKEATKLYLKYLSENNEILTYYKKELIWLITNGTKIHGAKKYSPMKDLYNKSNDFFFDEKLIDNALNANSFSYKTLRFIFDWILQISFNYSEFENFCKLLKTKRDLIAHGEVAYVDFPNDCAPWHNKTLIFIDSLKDALTDSAKNLISAD